jgi:DNA primase
MAGSAAGILSVRIKRSYIHQLPRRSFFIRAACLWFRYGRREIRKSEQAVIVEGYMDVIGLHQAGFHNAISPMGTALTEDQFTLLKKFSRNIILALDPDAAGEKATLRGLETARQTLDQETELRFDARGLLHAEAA